MASKFETLTNIKPVRAVREVAQDISDILEPYLILHEVGGRTGIHPAELRTDILSWHYPSVGGHLMFLDSLKVITREVYERVIERHRDWVPKYLRDHSYDVKTGGFRQWEGTRKFRASEPTVEATANAIKLVRHFARVDDEQPLGYQNAVELLGQERMDQAGEFVKQSEDQELGGFHHNPEMNTTGQGRPSIWNTRHALSVLWNLQQGNHGKESAKEFLSSCLQPGPAPTGGIGFRESVTKYSSRNPSSGATASALRILESLGEHSWIQKHRSELITFLQSCWSIDKKGLGGFSHMPGGEPFSLYTNAVLSSLDVLEVDVDDLLPGADSRQQLIDFYAEVCRSREKDRLLFGFAPGWAPNSNTMRNTIYTLKSLSERHADFRKLFEGVFEDTVKVVDGMYAFVLTAEYVKWLGLLEKWSGL